MRGMNQQFFERSQTPGFACFPGSREAALFVEPLERLEASAVDGVRPLLDAVDTATRRGLHAAGYVAYEAAPAFDPALAAHPRLEGLPLACFFLYRDPLRVPMAELSPPEGAGWAFGPWQPGCSREAYDGALERVRAWIAAGDTYQINLTFPMEARFEGAPFAAFLDLHRGQRSGECAFLNCGGHSILSLSPELFFRLDGGLLETRPMKGTIARGRWPEEDREQAQRLIESPKERAENVMIVDLLRNDMGRISDTGSVAVSSLFDTERYRTLWQMTSTVRARTGASLGEIFGALFPSGSVTGAPKVRAMQIIRELEPEPRGVYCGAVGRAGPGGKARFNVAIRTILLDAAAGEARYSVGSGVTWDSRAGSEHAECLLKAEVLRGPAEPFHLLETILWDGRAFPMEREHLERMAASADYFHYPFDARAARKALMDAAAPWAGNSAKVRLLLGEDGFFSAEAGPVPEAGEFLLALADTPVQDTEVFLFHKTTRRAVYENARAAHPEAGDVLLWNARGELTESCIANAAFLLGGRWLTPPVPCGLLPGVMRRRLLERGRISEGVVRVSDLPDVRGIALFNAVRGWMPARLMP